MLSLRGVSEFGRTHLNFKTSKTPELQVAKAMAWNYPIDAAMKYYDKTQFGRDRTPGDPQRFYNVNSLVWRCGAAGVRALPVLTAHDISLPEQ